ncbi:MAG: homoserine dehydrogenase [Clostridia bacterium]|nr:homoserine dehydrogenase [Clostridia bacterium]
MAEIKKVGVALLGVGVVGGGTYEILTTKREMIKKNDNIDIEVKCVLERNIERCKQLGIDEKIVSQNIDDIVNNKDIQIVAEFFGGVEPAKSFLIKCLKAGKSIVTANKEMFSKSWPELEAAAKEGGAGLYFEASCVGGVPVIRALTDSMQGNAITGLKGIVNGTTNYILSKMSDEGVDYDTCLKEAQKLGYAEANPTADVDGFDAMYKNSILSSLAYRKRVPIDKIYREGISGVSVDDINYGKELGYAIKLLAISKCLDGKIEARVHPVFIPASHPLASVKGSFNALYMHGDNVDDVMFYGRGAGALPTGSAIVSDIVFAAGKLEKPRRFYWEDDVTVNDDDFASDFVSKYYVRVAGNKAAAEKAFSGAKIEILKSVEKDGQVIFLTGEAHESTMKNALAAVDSVKGLIRVED